MGQLVKPNVTVNDENIQMRIYVRDNLVMTVKKITFLKTGVFFFINAKQVLQILYDNFSLAQDQKFSTLGYPGCWARGEGVMF